MGEKTEIKSMRYEQAFEELQTVILTLETGEKPLDETLALYERGQALYAHCQKLLEEAELKIETIENI